MAAGDFCAVEIVDILDRKYLQSPLTGFMETERNDSVKHHEDSLALGHLRHWLIDRRLPVKVAGDVVHSIRSFHARALDIIRSDVAIGLTGKEPESARPEVLLRLLPLDPSFKPNSATEEALLTSFQREVAEPLSTRVDVRFKIIHELPEEEEPHHIGYYEPSGKGWRELSERLRAASSATSQFPDIAQEIYSIIRSLPEKPQHEQRALAERVHELAAEFTPRAPHDQEQP